MIPNTDPSPGFDQVLDSDEKILWIEKPLKLPYLAAGFGVFFICFFLLGGFLLYHNASQQAPVLGVYLMGVAVMVFSTFEFIQRRLYVRHICYAYTNKRILMRHGFRGKKIKVIEFENVVEITVDINSIERYYGAGSIKLFTGEISYSDAGTPEKMYVDLEAIIDPYVVFHNLKNVMSDFKATQYELAQIPAF
ncbi:PH domain-containing protein [Paraflavitalea soli]|uniref:PH domain-containing protein n=1 Tax=Paraflavitalea soli TaxID=2315862 RepID=A0A3B7MUV1_9BACT|nr:PH domain-containing protein [Paraflavitalea soli]AXY78314.1 PH domain-containing protein [Paraflavitalea soli]